MDCKIRRKTLPSLPMALTILTIHKLYGHCLIRSAIILILFFLYAWQQLWIGFVVKHSPLYMLLRYKDAQLVFLTH